MWHGQCICLLATTMSCAETAELIKMSFGVWTRVGPRNYVLGGCFHPQGKGQFCVLWGTFPCPLWTHTRLTALCPGLPGWAGTRKVKPIWILLKQEIVSSSGISWAICKSAPRSRQITTPAPRHSVFLQAGCPSCRPTNSVKALKAFPCPLWSMGNIPMNRNNFSVTAVMWLFAVTAAATCCRW